MLFFRKKNNSNKKLTYNLPQLQTKQKGRRRKKKNVHRVYKTKIDSCDEGEHVQ
jgi:hypothetical protein